MARTPQLLGPDGRPIERRTLTQAVAAPAVTGVRRPFSGTVATGLTPERLATILKRATEGGTADYLTLAEEMEERDPHYAAVLGTRKRAVAGVEPIVTPGDDSPRAGEIADFVRAHLIDRPWWGEMVVDLLDALGKGYAVCEILWQTGKHWTPIACPWRDPRYFVWDETRTALRLAEDGQPHGEDLPPGKFIVHTSGIKSGLPVRGGLARLVAWSVLFKSYSVKDWAAFSEVYGLPLRLGRYGQSATQKDIDTLVAAVAGIGTDAAAVLPESMRIEFQGISEGRGGADLFERFARYLDEQISKAVVGQTMTTDDGSSLAQAQVHRGVQIDVAQADAAALANSVNRDLVRVAVDLNFGPQDAYPWLSWPITAPEDTTAAVNQVQALVPLGMRFRVADIRERLGWAEPEDDDEVLGAPAPAGDATDPAPAPQRAAPQAATDTAEADPVEAGYAAIAEAMDHDDWEVMAPSVSAVLDAAADADDPDDLIERLARLVEGGGLDSQALADRLARSTLLARALGDAPDPDPDPDGDA
ncbi:DUF935 domain-containing protein [Roseospira goensis]|uniref:Phage gp29-like protein n=1 Tax=Roseospira goensis TaxID=391922 RepID=A0A7W6S2K9_9PROT|nr:DUF935 domain-containing protein [Roseospira goensis]MBB4287738.1 phage gp29-like protein [Roseospira goensis]